MASKKKVNTSTVEYWKKRLKENSDYYDDLNKNLDKKMDAVYKKAKAEIEKDINAFYQKYAEKEGLTLASAKKQIDSADIEALAEKAKEYVRNKDFSEEANAEMKLYNTKMYINRLEFLKMQLALELEKLTGEASEITEAAIKKAIKNSGILAMTANKDNQLKDILYADFHGEATWSDRIWANQKILRATVDEVVTRALIRGEHSSTIVSKIMKKMESSESNARRLARTEIARAQTVSELENIKNLEYNYYKIHNISSNGNICEICKSYDDKVLKVSEAVTGYNLPPFHPNCRCSISAATEADFKNQEHEMKK